MIATLLERFAHMSILAHMLLMVGVVCAVVLAVVAVSGDDWNKVPDDFDNWENVR